MTRLHRLLISGLAATICTLCAQTSLAGDLRSQLIGAWSLVSETHSDGAQPFGPHPIGIAIYDASGHFSTQRMRADLPKFAANSRAGGTDAENRAVVDGILSIFGTFTVDESEHTRLLRIIGSSYPNMDDGSVKESISIAGDVMTVTNPVTTLVWRRAERVAP